MTRGDKKLNEDHSEFKMYLSIEDVHINNVVVTHHSFMDHGCIFCNINVVIHIGKICNFCHPICCVITRLMP